MYADLFLYVPWQDEETFLGEASRSEEACQKMWDEWGEAAKDLKKQLYRMIKESWLSWNASCILVAGEQSPAANVQ